MIFFEILYRNEHLSNENTQILNETCDTSLCAIAKSCGITLQANHQVDELKCKIM